MSVLDAAARAVWAVTYPDALDTYDDPELRPERDLARAQARAALAVAPAPSDDDREALEHLFRSEFKASKIMGQMMANAVLSVGFHSQPKLTDPSSEGYPEFEEWEQLLFQHRPVISMHDGGIAGCACLDRVFVKKSEDWGTHLAQVVMDILARRSPVSPPEDVAALLAEHDALRDDLANKPGPEVGGAVRRVLSMLDRMAGVLRAPVPVGVVTTVEELDALPPQTVIHGAGLVYEKYANSGGMWSGTRKRILVESRHLAMILPARVLFRPTREEGQ